VTVTRIKRTNPPATIPHARADAPSALTVARVDPRAEARQHRDVLKTIGYFAARAGQWRTITQTVAGTRLPLERAYQAVDSLVDYGLLTLEMRPTPTGTTVPTWIRLDPTSGASE
jgi:hypothetical protein